jgi:hypothetical protein
VVVDAATWTDTVCSVAISLTLFSQRSVRVFTPVLDSAALTCT